MIESGDRVTCESHPMGDAVIGLDRPAGLLYVHNTYTSPFTKAVWVQLTDRPGGVVVAVWPEKFCKKEEK